METKSSNRSLRDIFERIGDTPICAVPFRINGCERLIYLKLEGLNPAGSAKDRTAAFLIEDLESCGLLKPDSAVVESTSGNLGISLAFICRELGIKFTAVIDPKTTPENRSRLQDLGAQLETVEESDQTGGYLLSRLARVQTLVAASNRHVWTDQYHNLANPRAHYCSTGPEICKQMDGRVDALFIAVSTGGTLAGLAQYFREVSPNTLIIAVDAVGSVIFKEKGGSRKLTGIGSSQCSSFIRPEHYDAYMLVNDQDAFATCRYIRDEFNILVGGSSGAVVFACVQCLTKRDDLKRVVCLSADSGTNYASTIFSDRWLVTNALNPSYLPASLLRHSSALSRTAT
jgi:2,3-diaminopropionate biosynthesis protein SbnA